MPPNFMTALGGRGEAQSALLAYGGHETGQQLTAGFSLAPGTLSTGCLLKYLCLLSDKTESRGPSGLRTNWNKALKSEEAELQGTKGAFSGRGAYDVARPA